MKYRIEERGIFVGESLLSRTIPYEEIIQISEVKIWEAVLKSANPFRPPMIGLSSRFAINVLLLELKSKRLIALTPDNIGEFAHALREAWRKVVGR